MATQPETRFIERERIEAHLQATIGWLVRAQDVTRCGGVSAGYTLGKGWSPAYPETTGYIIPTFMAFARVSGDGAYRWRALQMADWLLGLQQGNGAFPGGVVSGSNEPSVFNTGQILFGLLRAWQETGDSTYLNAAARGGDWLVSVQDDDGSWRRHDFLGHAHAYNSRTAWALALLAAESGNARFAAAAARNLEWVASLADPDGFFRRAEFETTDGWRPRLRSGMRAVASKNWPSFYCRASLHTIAYTLQGLFETAWELGISDIDSRVLASGRQAAAVLARDLRGDRLAGFYGPTWKRATRSLCLTGLAQMGIVWWRMADKGSLDCSADSARAVHLLVNKYRINHARDEIRGAVPGSSPIWGQYLPFRYPNWAAKFTADLLMLHLFGHTRPEDVRAW